MNEHAYRKRPVTVRAFQMTQERRWDNSDWPDWLNEAWLKDHDRPGALFPTGTGRADRLCIFTLEGTHLVSWGDWIIRGVKGELYPCKPDIFEATYEEAGEPVSYLWARLSTAARSLLVEVRLDGRVIAGEFLAEFPAAIVEKIRNGDRGEPWLDVSVNVRPSLAVCVTVGLVPESGPEAT